jgi:hypothetical protein
MPVATEAKRAELKTPKLNRYPFLALRFWHGMIVRDWLRLLVRNRFRVHPIRWGLVATVSAAAVVNSIARAIQQMLYGRAIAGTEIEEPPIFVIGHWRSGTTMLHELMVLDDQFAYPTTYECFAPHHFIVTGKVLPKLLWLLLPSKRPMDNMSVSFKHPQEDEFALLSMGAPSPIMRMAFPNHPPPWMEFLDMEDVDQDELTRWQDTLSRFVRTQTYAKCKPIVLKSPTHTGRVEILSQMFPGAKFIHMVRNPESLFPSTRRLWISLDLAQGFQLPRHEHLDEFVFTAFERMYGGFERQRKSLDSSNICDVRYEELVKDPVGTMRRIYEELDLGDFEQTREKIEQYVEQKKSYQTNQHELEPEIMEEIRRRWSGYYEKYGYE